MKTDWMASKTARDIRIPADLMPRMIEVKKSTAILFDKSTGRYWNEGAK